MTDSKDLIALLREAIESGMAKCYDDTFREAADRITALEAEVARLRGVVGEIKGGHIPGIASLALAHDWHAVVNLFQARARAALEGQQ